MTLEKLIPGLGDYLFIEPKFIRSSDNKDFEELVSEVAPSAQVLESTGGDDTQILQDAIDHSNGESWIVLNGEFNLSGNLSGKKARILANDAVLKTSAAGDALTIQGVKVGNYQATGGYTQGRSYVLLKDTTGIKAGHLIRFVSTTEQYHPSRSYFYKGGDFIVTRVAADRVYLTGALNHDISAVDTVEVYEPGQLMLQGKLRIENTGALPNGQTGLMLKYSANSIIEGLTVDNFVTCISTTFCVNVNHIGSTTERAWYTGSGTSYGFATISSRNVQYESCSTRTGRHGHTGGGWEPVDNVVMKNCHWFSEQQGNQYSLDFHDNCGSITIENCEMDSFTINGNVKMENCTVHHREKVDSSYKSGDDANKCNYVFDNIQFPNGGQLTLSGYAQSGGTWTMDKVGSIKLSNIHVKGGSLQFNMRAKDSQASMPTQNIDNVIVENCTNVMVLMKDSIENLTLRNYKFLNDAVHIYQYTGASLIKNIIIENAYTAARYTGIQLLNFKRATFINCSDLSMGYDSPRGIITSPNTQAHVTFINCDYTNHTQGFSFDISVYTRIDSAVGTYGTPKGQAITQVPTLTGTAAPTVIPSAIGQEFLDTANKKLYKAFGTTAETDWVVQN
ncbi:hypothetical protein M1K46_22685 [Fictibacillus sp. WQ 8-8]|uniref:hypothetical protein n=1 Tax=Fictibacillus sp. WQ 8-8 TaxID=2938788 RepID=UPI0021087489|nr:hypothetical protein [Fictibacillus sp. WQ 8-8]MCQ6268396.1 hypothetical protein [Fictibacillus sp. WQ 8-8]